MSRKRAPTSNTLRQGPVSSAAGRPLPTKALSSCSAVAIPGDLAESARLWLVCCQTSEPHGLVVPCHPCQRCHPCQPGNQAACPLCQRSLAVKVLGSPPLCNLSRCCNPSRNDTQTWLPVALLCSWRECDHAVPGRFPILLLLTTLYAVRCSPSRQFVSSLPLLSIPIHSSQQTFVFFFCGPMFLLEEMHVL